MTRLEELKAKRDLYQQELEDLHLYEPSEQWYKMRRYELECQIVFLDEAIDDIEKGESVSTFFKVVLFGSTLIVAIAILIILIWS